MARACTTLDSFNAVAEPQRRRVLDLLRDGDRPVNDMVISLGLTKPQVSKHLGVLRQVGLVNVRKQGRQRVYQLNGDNLKPIHEWVKTYERFWQHQLHAVKQRAEAKALAMKSKPTEPPIEPKA
jgi:DNA-binding transcriptional ArsR family regulator